MLAGIIVLKLMQRLIKSKYSGATSLLVVLALGMFMIVLVSGIAALSLREQQQTRNTEFSNRALQTAEAGVKVAVQKLSANPNYTKTGCAPGPDFENIIQDSSLNQEITCIEVKNSFDSYEGFAEGDKSSQLIIKAPAVNLGIKNVQLRWHSKTLDAVLPNYAMPNSGPFYPTSQNPAYQWASSVEMTFIYWPVGPTISGDNIKIATVFFTPGNQDLAHTAISTKCEKQSGAANLGEYRCVTNPSSSEGFDLSSVLGVDSTNHDYVVRIKPRYTDTHFQFTAYDKNKKQMNIQSTKAQIDVTARSGDLYRRIKAEKVIAPTVLDSLFDSVLYAGAGSSDNTTRDICKNLVVRANGTLAPTTSAPLCTPN